MKHDHQHHHGHHNNGRPEAEDKARKVEERLGEKTLHGHEHAMHSDTGHHSPHGGHDHHRMMIGDFKKRFWVSLLLSVPVIILSPMVQHILGFTLHVPYSQYIAFVLSSIIFFYGGWPFLTGMVSELKKGAPGMMTLIGVAISVAYIYS